MKNVLVTGAAGGMGGAICRRLAGEGFNVFALDIKPVDIPGVKSFYCDVTDAQSVENAKKEILKHTEKLDCMVLAAGIYNLDSLVEIDEKSFTKIFNINLFGAYRMNRAFTPVMNKGGRIAIITSELAPLDPLPFTGIYAVTKAALEKYAHSLRSELALRDIKVIMIRPGAVKTGLLNVSTAALDRFCEKTEYYRLNAARFKKIVDSVETRSVPPEKIAGLVSRAFASRHPRYVYNINRNFLLKLLSALPDHMQQAILKGILK